MPVRKSNPSYLQKKKHHKSRTKPKRSSKSLSSGFLLPKMSADVLLQHAAESRPQVMKSPVKRVDAVSQRMAAK